MKTWIKTNLSKITLALALTGAVSGVTGLIIGTLAHHKTNDLTYFLDHDYNAHWGASIWESQRSDHYKIDLYFAIKPANNNDKKWDGNYPNGYFERLLCNLGTFLKTVFFK